MSGSHLRSLPPFVTLRGAWNQGNVTELMTGTREGLSVSLFEFDDTAADAEQPARLRVAVAADPSLRLPAFLVLPRSSSVNERSVPGLRGLLTPEVLAFFAQRPGVIAEGTDGGVLMARPPCPPAELGALLDDALALARALRRALRAGGPPS